MTFAEIRQAVYDDLNYTQSPEPAVQIRIERWINDGYKQILRRPEMVDLRQGTLTFETVAGQNLYGLPYVFDKKPDAIVQADNNWRLQYRTRDWFRTVDPGETNSGNPYVWTDWNLTPVARQPDQTTGSGLWAVSTDAADTMPSVLVRGIRLDGTPVDLESPVLTGTTRVQIGTVTDYVTVQSFTISDLCVGRIELYDDAVAGNLLSSIPIGKSAVQYQGVRLWPTPSAVLSYTVDGQFKIPELSEDSDVPMLPESFHDLLQHFPLMREYAKQGDTTRLALEDRDWNSGIARLKYYIQFPPDYNPIPGRLSEGRIGWNDLGGAYPADFFLS